ncbi:MAG: hypothetical protein HY904_05535 [Deltaproteobacteria bacterium]|nr:hypothetical protein [Deltaproteobacteria bacterium]
MTKTGNELVHLPAAALQEHAQDRAHAEELLLHVQRNMGLITDAFFEIGTALTELNNNRLYTALGYRSFEQMLERRRLMSQAQANKLIAVATLVPREAAVKLGPEKSYALTRLAQVSKAPGGLAALLESGKVRGRSLESVTVRELSDLTRELRGERITRASQARVQARRAARAAQAALRKAGVEGARVEAVGPRGESIRVSLSARDLERLVARVR